MEQFWNTRTENLRGLLVLSYEYEQELIQRAESGDQEASRLILKELISHIDRKSFESPAFDYLASNLRLFLEEGIPLDRALGIESDVNRGGRPRKYDDTEVAAVDLILRDHAGKKAEGAINWIQENVGADRRYIQDRRKEYDSRYNKFGAKSLMESRSLEDLLVLSGSLREKVAEVLPQT